MAQTQRKGQKVTLSIFLISMILSVTAGYYISNRLNTENSNSKTMEKLQLKGYVRVFIDGQLVEESHNVINGHFYNFLACKIFNITGSCFSIDPFGAFTIKSTSDNVSLTGMTLSTDAAPLAPSDVACTNPVVATGLTTKVADSKTQTFNSNSMQLTTTWVNTSGGTVNGIQKVCLRFNKPSVGFNSVIGAEHGFTAINLNNGQSITIQWTFTF